jgi:hypothetical protein
MNLGLVKKVLSKLYTDEMDITRHQEVVNTDSTTDTILPSTPLYSNIPCRISYESMEKPGDKNVDEIPLVTVPKIFCSVERDIIAGDKIVARRLDINKVVLDTIIGEAGRPSVFVTHKEVLISDTRSA